MRGKEEVISNTNGGKPMSRISSGAYKQIYARQLKVMSSKTEKMIQDKGRQCKIKKQRQGKENIKEERA